MMTWFSTLSVLMVFQFSAVDPRDDWKTKTTEHFYIHHLEEAEEIANRVVQISEPAFKELTSRFLWRPSDRIHVVIHTRDDIANGMSTPFPYNSIYLNIALPPVGSGLDEYDEWINMLFTHELTHTIHVDMVKGFNKLWRTLLGRTVIPPTAIPNSVQPQWLIEGIAVDHETLYSSGGRGRSSFIEMYFRTAAMEDRLLPIERGTYWNDVYPFGGAAYWYGVRFHQYLREEYGEDKIYEFANLNSRWVLPGFFNFKTRKIFGKSFDRIWNEWRAKERREQINLINSYQPRTQAILILNEQSRTSYLQGTPAFDHESETFYFSSRRRYEKPQLQSLQFKSEGEVALEKIKGPAPSGPLHILNKDFLIFNTQRRPNPWRLTQDLSLLDLKKNKSYPLTEGLRIRDVTSHGRSLFFVQTQNMKSRLVKWDLDLLDQLTQENFEFDPQTHIARSDDAFELIFEAKDFDRIDHPQISPDGSHLVFSLTQEGGWRDLILLDLKTGEARALTQDSDFDNFPSFSADGEWIIFSSDRSLGPREVRVYNAYALHWRSGRLQQLTDVWTGVYFPRASRSHLIFGFYGEEGFRAASLPLQLDLTQARPLKQERAEKKQPPLVEKYPELSTPEVKSSSYKMGDTLWPHFVIPFWFYTESDTAIGAITGSRDPLGFHQWQALSYYFFSPNRPGAILNYVNQQIPYLSWGVDLAAGITNYGRIWNLSNAATRDYYERRYQGGLSAFYRLGSAQPGRPQFSVRHGIRYEDRRSLIKRPGNLLQPSDFNDPSVLDGVLYQPDEMQLLSFQTQLEWATPVRGAPYAIAPYSGSSLSLNLEYSPKLGSFSDKSFLFTSLRARHYQQLYKEVSLALRGAVAIQWLDVLYQRSFRLGGSIGESPFSDVRRFSLRGLPEGALRGEGIVSSSVELRFPLLSQFLGFGTAPIWIKNLHGVIFSDAGETFQHQEEDFLIPLRNGQFAVSQPENFEFNRWTLSVGAELRTSASLWYAQDYIFRLGYGRVLFLAGQNLLKENQERFDEIYVQLGPSF